jgi:alpha-tubulin suppressor-like RCC1 family protein
MLRHVQRAWLWSWSFACVVACKSRGEAPAAPSATSVSAPTPSASAPPPAKLEPSVISIAVGDRQSFAVRRDGRVYAWGDNRQKKLGFESPAHVSVPTPVPALEHMTQISTTDEHSCGVHRDGRVSCWGRNFAGSLGRGDAPKKPAPAPAANVVDAVQVVSANRRSCALTRKGQVFCWGIVAENTDLNQPPAPMPKLESVVDITQDGRSACGRNPDGSVSCWDLILGEQWNYGASVDGKFDNTMTTPARVKNVSGVKSIALFGDFCALLDSGRVQCTGLGGYGGFGDAGIGYYLQRLRDVDGASELRLERIAKGPAATCGIDKQGQLFCWGGKAKAPARVANLSNVRQVALGAGHACALDDEGTVFCWGKNDKGQLGDGTTRARESPLKVAIPEP